ncbi:hypothetical protein ES704_03591 [subsurface metagenome]|jgi:hypothetical protein
MDISSIFAIIFVVVGAISGLFLYLIETKSLANEKVKTVLWITVLICVAGFFLLLFFNLPGASSET